MARKRNRKTEGAHRLAGRAKGQRGLVSLDQMEAEGFSQRYASYGAEVGKLHRVHRGVYALGHRHIDQLGWLEASLLACGEGAVVSHLTAAAHWGLVDRWPTLIDITVTGQAGRKVDGVRCRRCRYPHPDEITHHRGIVCTTPARTLVDLAGLLGRKSLRKVVERAAHLKLLDLDAIVAAIERAKGRRGLKSLRGILLPWFADDGAVPDLRSDFEAFVLPRLVEMGLPRPRTNVPLRLEGERLTVDFYWPEQRLVVETDGTETHANPLAFQQDRLRDQRLVAAGYRASRVTWEQMTFERQAVIARIARSLLRRID